MQLSDAYAALCRVLDRSAGLRYSTVLEFVEQDGIVSGRRILTTVPDTYPTGLLKPLPQSDWLDQVYRQRTLFVAGDSEVIRSAYPDHELVFALRACRLANFPVIVDDRCIAIFNVAQGETHDWDALSRQMPDAVSILASLLKNARKV